MEQYLDLHIHTNRSDGALSAVDVLNLVRQRNLAAFSITDHDTIDGYRDMKSLVGDSDPELVTGLELSAAKGEDDLHILGYLFDPDNVALNESLLRFQERRVERGREIVQKLKGLGIDIPFEGVLKTANNSAVGRPHIAETMYRLGATRSYLEAFHKYIGKGKPANVPKTKITPEEAITMIHQAGGVAVLAHPLIDGMIKYVDEMAGYGLDGIELWHYCVGAKETRRIKGLAKKYNLLLTGGSDFHGREGYSESLGSHKVPIDCLEKLKEKVQQIRGQL